MAVHKVKEKLTLNRPAYVGMCILDLIKMLIYDFHYNYIKKKYNNRARLLFTDTDSLTYEIEAEDVCKDFWNDKDMFDNSDYQESSPYFCNVNNSLFNSVYFLVQISSRWKSFNCIRDWLKNFPHKQFQFADSRRHGFLKMMT